MACADSEPSAEDAGIPGLDATPVADTGPTDAGAADSGFTDTGPDAGPDDTGVVPDSGTTSFPTLADYRVCAIDTECPVGLGRCVKEVNLNRADSTGETAVPLSDLDSRIPVGQGICTKTCTQDLSTCETMSFQDSTGASVPFTCQVVVVGASPYPAIQPAFPFDTQIDATEMALGEAFGALCRPPFQLNEARNANFCGTCDSAGGCADGTCWRFETNSPVQAGQEGVCLELNSTCPIGFEVRSLQDGATDLGEHCVPLQETCGPCLDRDEDQWGAGHCAHVQVDCDDRNPLAYYDRLNPTHAFPTYCGVQDYNCNGLSDEAEQVGVEAFKAFHCEFCGDDADGLTVNPGAGTEALLECVSGQIQVAQCTDAGQVHCSGDPRQTGCEATAAAGGTTYYRDSDGDMYGDPNTATLGCPGGGAPAGFVTDATDCNDADGDIHPNVPDLCDCWGDCAQPGAEVDNDCDGTTDEDVTAYRWGVDADGDGAPGTSFDSNSYCGAPAPNVVIGFGFEDCNDSSTGAYGAHDAVTDAAGTILSLPLAASPVRDANGNLYVTRASAATEVCDGFDNNCVQGADEGVRNTYYLDQDTDTFGDPAVTILACSAPMNYVADNTDCNDADMTIYPNATELCDGIDRDCLQDGDALAVLGGTCVTGLLGNCSAGTQTACTAGGYVCTQVNQPTAFDDPHNLPDDEDCDGPEIPIYVAPSGNGANTGTASSPKGTLAQAIAGAPALGATQVHMLAGSHVVSAPQVLVSDLDVVGGFSRSGNVWTAAGGQSQLLHDGTPVGRQAVLLEARSVDTTVAYLDLQVAAGAATGVNHIGLYASQSDSLRLQSMSITIAAGTDGADGTDGAVGSDGVTSPVSGLIPVFCGGVQVSGGAGGSFQSPAGDAGMGENPGAGGATPAAAGALGGTPGGFSANAAVGGRVSAPTVINGVWNSSQSTAAQDGPDGSGGGGGYAVGQGALGGNGGSGGCGGTAGENAQSGGTAIGVFSYLSEGLTMDSVVINVGGGGDGGSGGRGGNGGAAGAGSPGLAIGPGTTAYVGGDGSSGGGGAGGGAGHGGHAYPMFHQGSTDLCNSPSLTNLVRNTTGLVGVRGSSGGRGIGDSNVYGGFGDQASDGFEVDCLWSAPCTGATCANGRLCLSGYCQP